MNPLVPLSARLLEAEPVAGHFMPDRPLVDLLIATNDSALLAGDIPGLRVETWH